MYTILEAQDKPAIFPEHFQKSETNLKVAGLNLKKTLLTEAPERFHLFCMEIDNHSIGPVSASASVHSRDHSIRFAVVSG